MAHPDKSLIFLELRDQHSKNVSFSAYDVAKNSFLWSELAFEEPWWISLAEVSDDILIFTIYTNESNPGLKSILAYDLVRRKELWWRNNYAISGVSRDCVFGVDLITNRETTLSIATGIPSKHETEPVAQNFSLRKPLQYHASDLHFGTVSDFLNLKCNVSPVSMIDYLEFEGFLIISCYVQAAELANFLFVFNMMGDKLVEEKIGDRLRGIAPDSFFILSGYLIFVKNSQELISYKLI